MSDNNQKTDAWGQNRNIPDSWVKNNKLPENWGKQSVSPDIKNNTGASPSKSNAKTKSESSTGFSDKAKSGVGLLAGAAKKVGGATKNAAGSAVEYAKSDEVKEKLNAAKNKAKSISDGAGSSLTDLKEKAGDAINERHSSMSELSDNTSDEIGEDTLDTAITEESPISDPSDDTSTEDEELSAETTAESDTDSYIEEPVDDEVYDTEPEEEYEYSEEVVAKTASSGSLKKNILIGAAVLAVGIGAIIGVGLIFKKGDKKPNSSDSSIETTAETSTAATSIVTTAETTTGNAQSSTTTVVTTSESDKSYTLEKNSIEIKIGETTNVNILHYPEECNETNEYWTSSDYNIASVNVHGYITGVSSGECIVSISCKDNPDIKTDISVVVIDEENTESSSISDQSGSYSPPFVSASIEEVSQYPLQGMAWYLVVSGNYSSYYYEAYAAWYPDWEYTSFKSGISTEGRLKLEEASVRSNYMVYVTPYNSNGTAGETVVAKYEPTSQTAITSCTKYGQINAPGGGPINGYTKSFAFDGGSMSCVRTDLMDKWHITAVNTFTKNGTTWYELYDTDDGDYYGWVDESHITFY
ncbi:hypothetical protein [uncultured Ruminococcus sp.]|uniref:hypothetical protein n=1 Tax=uncultured Ruminococcus sp. TaxID=165186 RepID=UPI0025F2D011|nr:hypothetical protein [uncultured Ruminococcus sp.]